MLTQKSYVIHPNINWGCEELRERTSMNIGEGRNLPSTEKHNLLLMVGEVGESETAGAV